MIPQFSFNEALRLAIVREKESQELYIKLGEKTNNSEVKKIFEFLLRQEIRHELLFAGVLEKMLPETFLPRSPEDNEYYAYIVEQLNTTKVSKDLTELQLDSFATVIDYAIAREKDAIIFYAGLKDLVLAADQEKIVGIIWEEAKHALILSNLKQKILTNKIKL